MKTKKKTYTLAHCRIGTLAHWHIGTLVLLLLLLFASCKPQKSADTVKPQITVTIEPLRYFTEAIAGEHFDVVSMVPKGVSPETYDPTPAQLVSLDESRAYFRIGYIGFEQTWIPRLQENAPDLPFYDMSQGIVLMNDNEPHIWNSTVNARIIARNVLHALCKLDPDHAPTYTERCISLLKRIAQIDTLITDELSAPEATRAFAIYHPALTYFARDYHLTQIPIEAEGKEPSPAQLRAVIDRCREKRVRVIFVQPEFDRRNAEIIASQIDARIIPINPLSYDWETEMLSIAHHLSEPQ